LQLQDNVTILQHNQLRMGIHWVQDPSTVAFSKHCPSSPGKLLFLITAVRYYRTTYDWILLMPC